MDRVAEYLRIPSGYGHWLEGLRWSANEDAVEYDDGGTFALGPQLALFLEGFAAEGRLIHFGFILHLFHLLGHGGRMTLPREALVFGGAFRDSGGSLRNAGGFCAVLCRRVPPAAAPPDLPALTVWLRGTTPRWPTEGVATATLVGEMPPWEPAAFQEYLLQALRPYALADLIHWFRHGRGPIPGGNELARELAAPRPRTLLDVWAALTQRSRLAGAAPFVPQLVSALTLPPRRLAHHELPLGGFSDVATRGHPEHLLPSQFALDGLEFVRRFAENELLYFRREEPHSRTKEELVVLLDQGVRTWGDVRLMLTAGVLALGRLAVRRRLPFLLTATSAAGQLLDPVTAAETLVAELLEASDLSPHPGLALERLLELPISEFRLPNENRQFRDVVLLTHPRSLAEADVVAAARRVGPGTRLFALVVDDAGQVQLSELRHGAPVKLTQFHVDPGQGRTAEPAAPEAALAAAWRGDVEPGRLLTPVGRLRLLAFDDAGQWLLAESGQGALHAWKVDEAQMVAVPRGLYQGASLTAVDAVLGVVGGFVVAGTVNGRLVAMHYDFPGGHCTAHILGPTGAAAGWKWYYFREWHSVVVRDRALSYGVDLATGQNCQTPGQRPPGFCRALPACAESERWLCAPPAVYAVTLRGPDQPRPERGPVLYLHADTGTLTLRDAAPMWPPFAPVADGQPLLRGTTLDRAWWSGPILAVAATRPNGPELTLRLFRGPQGRPLFEHRHFFRDASVALSRDGRRVAFPIGPRRLKVGVINPDGGYFLVTFDARRFQKAK